MDKLKTGWVKGTGIMILFTLLSLTAISQNNTTAYGSSDSINELRKRTAAKVLDTMYSQDSIIANLNLLHVNDSVALEVSQHDVRVQRATNDSLLFEINVLGSNYKKVLDSNRRAYKRVKRKVVTYQITTALALLALIGTLVK